MITYMLERKIKGRFEVMEYSAWLKNLRRLALNLSNTGVNDLRITKIVGPYFAEGYHAYYLNLVDGKFIRSKGKT